MVEVIALIVFFFLTVAILLLLSRDQAKLAGMVESLRRDVELMSDTVLSLRVRMKELEHDSNLD